MVRYEIRNDCGSAIYKKVKFSSASVLFKGLAKQIFDIREACPLVRLARVVELYNVDAPVVSGNYLKLCDYTTDKFDFYVMDSLMYKQDIDVYMTKNFRGFDWRYDSVLPQNSKDMPLVFKVVFSVVLVEKLTKKDCVVNKQGKQIWPVNTGKYPSKLVEMLNKKTEEINLVR